MASVPAITALLGTFVTCLVPIAGEPSGANVWPAGADSVPVSGGCCGWVSFVPPRRCWSRQFQPAGGRASTAFRGEIIDVHGEQNGSVYKQVTLGRSDVAPVSPVAEGRAGLLERCLDCKYGDHSPHLHPPGIPPVVPGRGRGFGPAVGPEASSTLQRQAAT